MADSEPVNFLSLPNELLERIFGLLIDVGQAGPHAQTSHLSALSGVRLTCRRFKLLADSIVWRILEVPPFSDSPVEGSRRQLRQRPTAEDWLLASSRSGNGLVKELRFMDPTSLPSTRLKRVLSARGALPSLLPQVASLDLSGLTPRSLTDVTFLTVIRQCSNLRTLNLSFSTELTDISVAGLCEHQRRQRESKLPVLERVSFSRCNRITFPAIAALVEILGSDLRCLKCLAIPSRGADGILEVLAARCRNIEELCFGDTDLGLSARQPRVWFDLGRNCRQLRSLNISGCSRITPECLSDLGKGRLAAVEFDGKEVREWSYLGLGKLGWNIGHGAPASEEGAEEDDDFGPVLPVVMLGIIKLLLPESLIQRGELELDLSNLMLPLPVLSYLSLHSTVASRVVGLDLTSTTIFVPNVAYASLSTDTHILLPIARRLTSLRTVSLAQLVPPTVDDLVFALSESCPNLEKIDLRGSFLLSDSGLASLNHLSKLVELDLKACERVTDSGVLSLLEGKSAKSLNLGLLSGISDAALKQLDMHDVVTLKLSGCTMISDEGIRAIVDGASGRLPTQLLCFHNLRLLSPPALVSLFRITPNLTSLNLFGCDMVTDEVLTGLGRYCERLESLCVSGCSVGDAGVRGLVLGDPSTGSHGCRRLRTLYMGFLVSSWSSDEISGGCVECEPPAFEMEPEDLQGMEMERGEEVVSDDWREDASDNGSAFGDGTEDDFDTWFESKMTIEGLAGGNGPIERPPLGSSSSSDEPSWSSSGGTRYSTSVSGTAVGSLPKSRPAVSSSYQSANSFTSVNSTPRGSLGLTDRSVELVLNTLTYLKILDISGSDASLDINLRREPAPALEWLKVRCCRRVRAEALERLIEGCPELAEIEMVGSGVDGEGRAKVTQILDGRL